MKRPEIPTTRWSRIAGWGLLIATFAVIMLRRVFGAPFYLIWIIFAAMIPFAVYRIHVARQQGCTQYARMTAIKLILAAVLIAVVQIAISQTDNFA